jgi:hypothetical protein
MAACADVTCRVVRYVNVNGGWYYTEEGNVALGVKRIMERLILLDVAKAVANGTATPSSLETSVKPNGASVQINQNASAARVQPIYCHRHDLRSVASGHPLPSFGYQPRNGLARSAARFGSRWERARP